ncbi:hypothetical protein N0V93_008198 [Gnomoniopsis smithogilvyi]|uniref:Piwi domain-containing protein n=1 Tax=Gnomoniopsis smithogilvyi TaxID=1191159 RepID=A0A9W9CUJ3_9PEZI|nr:hypothetical protein N0V93_008198 [Gnomoniopsis smithogilvyi]
MAHQGRGSGGPRGGPAQGGASVSRGQGGRGGRGGGRINYGPPIVYRPANGIIPRPDSGVEQVEDARQRARQSPSSALGSLTLTNTMPTRPGYGTEGKPMTVFTNYVTLTPDSNLVLYMYDMKGIQPNAVGRKLSQIIRLILNESNELAGYRNDVVSDFKYTLVSRKRFPIKNDRGFIRVAYKSEGEDEPLQHAQTYTVPLRLTKTLTFADLIADLTSTNPAGQGKSKLEFIQGLNILLNHHAKTNDSLVTIGSNKTFVWEDSEDNATDLGQGLKAMRGFITSVRAATNRILVNINVSHAAFYQEGKLTNLIQAFKAQPFGKTASRYELHMFLQRLRIRTSHFPEKRNRHGVVVVRQKTIWGLAQPHDLKRDAPPPAASPPLVSHRGAGPKDVKFWLRDQARSPKRLIGPQQTDAGPGRYISVYDYFKKTYGIETSNNFPVVDVGTEGRPSYLPAEVCIVLPGQNVKSRLSGEQTGKMVSFAVRPPWLNAKSIEEDGFETAGMSRETNPLLDQFRLAIGQSLITVPARLLKEPYVQYLKTNIRVTSGSWNMKGIQFKKGGKLKRWSFLAIQDVAYPPDSDDIRQNHTAVEALTNALRSNGLDGTNHDYIQGQELAIKDRADPELDAKFAIASKRFDLVLIILPGMKKTETFNEEVYDHIKVLGDIKYGIHTVCVIGNKFRQKDPQYLGNVALKFNIKLGGNNQAVEQSRLSFVKEDKTMLVGLDVTHPSPGSLPTAPSLAGMVASVDKDLGQWPATLRIQNSRQEMVSGVGSMLKTHLEHWRSLGKHNSLPDNIIVYRDGVSEGQYDDVLEKELPLLRQACKEMYQAGMEPKLTIIIVGKRHHTRFYPIQDKDMDPKGRGNLKPGTVVDRGITEEGVWDFFLQSHNVLQGTGRPAHYVVVLDEIFCARAKAKKVNAANEVEMLTQALCYTFGRATKAVSICTPAYYADILCERARLYNADLFKGSNGGSSTVASAGGQSLASVKVHERLRNTMFYL